MPLMGQLCLWALVLQFLSTRENVLPQVVFSRDLLRRRSICLPLLPVISGRV